MRGGGEVDLGVRVAEILNRHPAIGLALGVVRNGRLESFAARGLADVAAGTPITEDTIFRVASITKTFTAVAIMQLQEQGLIDLDAPANDYLRAFELKPANASWRPATVRDLLTHTAGVPETVQPWHVLLPDYGESVKAGRSAPPLAEFYGGALRLEAEPGTRFVYGNHSPAALGQIVEDVSDEPLTHYFQDHILAPLGMANAGLGGSTAVTPQLATGYRLRSRGPVPVPEREFATAAAASLCASSRDMARYLAALLNGGANNEGRILQPESVAEMFAPQYQPDPRLAGMGLAFFRVNLQGHRAVEHSGLLPGFDSQVMLAPDDGVAVMAFTNGTRQGIMWLGGEAQRLLGELVGAPDEPIRAGVPHHPEIWPQLCGWYRLSAGIRDLRLAGFMGPGIEVFIRRGRPMLRFLTPVPALCQGFPLHPDDENDPYVFRVDFSDMGAPRIAFSTGPHGVVTAVTLDHPLMALRLRKQSPATNPRRWAMGTLAALGTAGAAAAVLRAVRE